VVATVPVAGFPVRATFSADDSTVYVASRDNDSITLVENDGTPGVIGTILVGDQPFEMAIAPGGTTLYVANSAAETIGVVDLVSGMMTATVGLPDFPAGLALDPAGDLLYVPTGNWSVSLGPGPIFSIGKSGQFSVIDTESLVIVDQVITGLPPAQLDWNAALALGGVPSPFGDGLTVVEDPTVAATPGEAPAPSLKLAAPSPNPFAAGGVVLRYGIAGETWVNLVIYDAAGRRVATLVDAVEPAGEHVIAWDGRDESGKRAAPGVYFAELRAGTEARSTKLILVH
jgi:YVTN family beta-propeller protein